MVKGMAQFSHDWRQMIESSDWKKGHWEGHTLAEPWKTWKDEKRMIAHSNQKSGSSQQRHEVVEFFQTNEVLLLHAVCY